MKTETPMMMCGHAANGTKQTGEPVCVICFGMRVAGADRIDTMPDLTGRTASCPCGKKAPSKNYIRLAFFQHLPDREFDDYYCGHSGWD